jgi:hypothetical protein
MVRLGTTRIAAQGNGHHQQPHPDCPLIEDMSHDLALYRMADVDLEFRDNH